MLTLNPSKSQKKVAVIQSNYIPWIGYFAIIASVDVFVVYECVQYTKNDWRNRNQIQEKDGTKKWLSIPIRKFSVNQQFMETKVANHNWAQSHFNTLRQNFSSSKGWLRWGAAVKSLYEKGEQCEYLFQINRIFLDWTIQTLGISSEIVYLDEYPLFKDPNERLISILECFGTTIYLSGPAAENYINPVLFRDAHIDLIYINYNDLINNVLTSPNPVKSTTILQTIFEGDYEFRSH